VSGDMRDKGHRPAVRRNGWKLFKASGVGESMCTYLVYDSFGGSDQTANKNPATSSAEAPATTATHCQAGHRRGDAESSSISDRWCRKLPMVSSANARSRAVWNRRVGCGSPLSSPHDTATTASSVSDDVCPDAGLDVP
jgi:hypothetical protein